MTAPKWSSRQAFIDHTVRACLNRGVRTRKGILWDLLDRVSAERDEPVCALLSGASSLFLYNKISLTTSREDKSGHRDIWNVPKEYRYVSVQRVRYLVRKEENAKEGWSPSLPGQAVELRESLLDLSLIKAHWERQIARARQCVNQIEALEEFATNRAMR